MSAVGLFSGKAAGGRPSSRTTLHGDLEFGDVAVLRLYGLGFVAAGLALLTS
jgi:hypothetical protein